MADFDMKQAIKWYKSFLTMLEGRGLDIKHTGDLLRVSVLPDLSKQQAVIAGYDEKNGAQGVPAELEEFLRRDRVPALRDPGPDGVNQLPRYDEKEDAFFNPVNWGAREIRTSPDHSMPDDGKGMSPEDLAKVKAVYEQALQGRLNLYLGGTPADEHTYEIRVNDQGEAALSEKSYAEVLGASEQEEELPQHDAELGRLLQERKKTYDKLQRIAEAERAAGKAQDTGAPYARFFDTVAENLSMDLTEEKYRQEDREQEGLAGLYRIYTGKTPGAGRMKLVDNRYLKVGYEVPEGLSEAVCSAITFGAIIADENAGLVRTSSSLGKAGMDVFFRSNFISNVVSSPDKRFREYGAAILKGRERAADAFRRFKEEPDLAVKHLEQAAREIGSALKDQSLQGISGEKLVIFSMARDIREALEQAPLAGKVKVSEEHRMLIADGAEMAEYLTPYMRDQHNYYADRLPEEEWPRYWKNTEILNILAESITRSLTEDIKSPESQARILEEIKKTAREQNWQPEFQNCASVEEAEQLAADLANDLENVTEQAKEEAEAAREAAEEAKEAAQEAVSDAIDNLEEGDAGSEKEAVEKIAGAARAAMDAATAAEAAEAAVKKAEAEEAAGNHVDALMWVKMGAGHTIAAEDLRELPLKQWMRDVSPEEFRESMEDLVLNSDVYQHTVYRAKLTDKAPVPKNEPSALRAIAPFSRYAVRQTLTDGVKAIEKAVGDNVIPMDSYAMMMYALKDMIQYTREHPKNELSEDSVRDYSAKLAETLTLVSDYMTGAAKLGNAREAGDPVAASLEKVTGLRDFLQSESKALAENYAAYRRNKFPEFEKEMKWYRSFVQTLQQEGIRVDNAISLSAVKLVTPSGNAMPAFLKADENGSIALPQNVRALEPCRYLMDQTAFIDPGRIPASGAGLNSEERQKIRALYEAAQAGRLVIDSSANPEASLPTVKGDLSQDHIHFYAMMNTLSAVGRDYPGEFEGKKAAESADLCGATWAAHEHAGERKNNIFTGGAQEMKAEVQKLRELVKQVVDADHLVWNGSPQYRDLMEAARGLERTTGALADGGRTGDAGQMQEYHARLTEVREKAQAYMTHRGKPADSKGIRRVAAAKAIAEYVDIKAKGILQTKFDVYHPVMSRKIVTISGDPVPAAGNDRTMKHAMQLLAALEERLNQSGKKEALESIRNEANRKELLERFAGTDVVKQMAERPAEDRMHVFRDLKAAMEQMQKDQPGHAAPQPEVKKAPELQGPMPG